MKLSKIRFLLFVSASILFSLFLFGQDSTAVPAANKEFTFNQPSGESFKATLGGDEWINWATSNEDDVLVQDTDGYWKYAEINNSYLKPGKVKYKINARPKNAMKKKEVLDSIKQKKIKKSHDPSKDPKPSPLSLSSSGSTDNATSNQSAGDPFSITASQTRKIVVFLVEFSNANIKYSDSDWSNRVFGNAGSTVNGYYNEASFGKFQFSPAEERSGTINDGIVKVRLNYPHPNTGSNTGSANQKIVTDSLIAADQYIDYSVYDTNNDGNITDSELLIITVVAGNEAACGGPSPSIWAHKWGFSISTRFDGKTFTGWKGYTQLGELQYSNMATIGTLCHELGHDLGLPDLYDTDYSSSGVGIHSLMAAGSWGRASTGDAPGSSPSHLDAWSESRLGFVTPQVVDISGNYTVTSSNTGNYVVLKIPTSNPKQYFLVENRQFAGYDRALSLYCVSGGIAIWHIDEAQSGNSNEADKLVDIEEANEGKLGYSQLDTSRGGAYDHYYYVGGSNTTFNYSTTPNSNLYGGAKSNIAITVKSSNSSSMTVNITKPSTLSPKGAIETPSGGSTVRKVCIASGWFLDADGVSKIEILVDGIAKGQASYGDLRNDIYNLYPQYDNPNCGYQYSLDVSSLSDGTHALSVRETSNTGVITTLPPVDIIIENMAKITISYTLSETAAVTVELFDSQGKAVKTLESSVQKSAGSNSVKWDGRDSSGKLVEDGIYTYKVSAVNQAGLSAKPLTGTFKVDRVPHVVTASAAPNPFTPDGVKKAAISYVLSKPAKVSISLSDPNSVSILNGSFSGTAGENILEWDGKDKSGNMAADGIYKYSINVLDSSGNVVSNSTGSLTVDRTAPVISSNKVNSNPFTPTGSNTVQISYYLSEKAKMTIKISKSDGSLIKMLSVDVLKASGLNYVDWDGKDTSGAIVPDGTYLYTIEAADLVGLRAVPVSGSFAVGPGSSTGLKITSLSANPNPFAPNGSNKTTISFNLSDNATVSINIYDANKTLVRNLASNLSCIKGTNSTGWDGKNNSGSIVASGNYTYEINAAGLDGTAATPVTGVISVNSTSTGGGTGGGTGGTGGSLTISSVSDSPDPFSPNGSSKAAIRFSLTKNAAVSIKVYDKNNTLVKTISLNAVSGSNSAYWDGKNEAGATVGDGVYTYTIDAVDSAGNKASQAKGTITVDGTPPSIYDHRADPPVISP